ncbi:hypothetical protein [Caballeronia grimmiae]|uniref:hypothetical protein n=1 Tax=Caballeronia grimmiae TaxID=1071679 RepID=UPI0038B8A5CF
MLIAQNVEVIALDTLFALSSEQQLTKTLSKIRPSFPRVYRVRAVGRIGAVLPHIASVYTDTPPFGAKPKRNSWRTSRASMAGWRGSGTRETPPTPAMSNRTRRHVCREHGISARMFSAMEIGLQRFIDEHPRVALEGTTQPAHTCA